MATYNVYMGQGIWIPDLRNNMLLTGAGGVSNRVQSCSAIVLFNTDTKSAGMYHFPAGNITEYKDSQLTIGRIANRVLSPIQVTIAVGKLSKKTDMGAWLPAESDSVMNNTKLQAFMHEYILQNYPDGRVSMVMANTGYVTATCNANGKLVIGDQNPGTGNYTDLKHHQEGVHDNGAYRTYGFANRAG